MKQWRSFVTSRWLLALLAGAIILLAAIGLSRGFSTPEPMMTEQVDRGDIEKVVLATGTLKPSMQVNVGAQVNGQLRKLYVRQGDKVEKGQLLAEIDPTLQESDLSNATAQLASAKAPKLASQAMLVRYRQELNRQQAMMRDGSGVRSDVEQAQAQYDAQRQQVEMNDAQIVQAEMVVKTANANLSYTRIIAPISGEVLGIVTNEGQTIVSSQTAPTILVLAVLDKMLVQTRISEADIQKIQPGQPLWFYVIANPEKRYTSRMGFVQPAPQEALEEQANGNSAANQQANAVYYNGTFAVDNAQRELKTSMTAQVFVRVAEAKNVLRVPVSTLGRALSTDSYLITVLENGKPQQRKIRIGINDRQFAQVLEGLQLGDRVVMPADGAQG